MYILVCRWPGVLATHKHEHAAVWVWNLQWAAVPCTLDHGVLCLIWPYIGIQCKSALLCTHKWSILVHLCAWELCESCRCIGTFLSVCNDSKDRQGKESLLHSLLHSNVEFQSLSQPNLTWWWQFTLSCACPTQHRVACLMLLCIFIRTFNQLSWASGLCVSGSTCMYLPS